jgi:circadian clock protein KaiC
MSVPSREQRQQADQRASTGIPGLDSILCGGLTVRRLYLVEGVPGSGKTTLALQFLMDGVRRGEEVLYVTLSESSEELVSVAASHGWSLDGVSVYELAGSEGALSGEDQYTMFHPSEVELGETTRAILSEVERILPTRVVFDSLSELRLLAGNALRYRRQILALKQYFAGRNCTVLLLDDMTNVEHDLQVQSIAHAVVRLDQVNPEFGVERRRLRVVKYRGVAFRGGFHDYIIAHGGLVVFPSLIANEHRTETELEPMSSGIQELDTLLGGGIERGTSTLITGAAGTGKSSLAMLFAWAAAERGERAALFIFEESAVTLLTRAAALGMDLRPHITSGLVTVQQVDPAEFSPGELVHRIRSAVETRGARVVCIDSLNGYLNAMPGEQFLILQLHELLTYLGQAGVATLLMSVHRGVLGSHMQGSIDASYLADNVIQMRYFELRGEVRQAISVIKKRGGGHERTIREFSMKRGGIHVGPVLRDFRGILTGVPVLEPNTHNATDDGGKGDGPG